MHIYIYIYIYIFPHFSGKKEKRGHGTERNITSHISRSQPLLMV